MKQNSGVSLIELLVSVAIIGLLCAFLLPAASKLIFLAKDVVSYATAIQTARINAACDLNDDSKYKDTHIFWTVDDQFEYVVSADFRYFK